MKNDANFVNDVYGQFKDHFKPVVSDGALLRSFHDVIWQIAVNRQLDERFTNNEVVIFHVNISGEHGNELVLAISSGGYQHTGCYFLSENYNDCCDVLEELNSKFFQVDKNEQDIIITKSMNN